MQVVLAAQPGRCLGPSEKQATRNIYRSSLGEVCISNPDCYRRYLTGTVPLTTARPLPQPAARPSPRRHPVRRCPFLPRGAGGAAAAGNTHANGRAASRPGAEGRHRGRHRRVPRASPTTTTTHHPPPPPGHGAAAAGARLCLPGAAARLPIPSQPGAERPLPPQRPVPTGGEAQPEANSKSRLRQHS